MATSSFTPNLGIEQPATGMYANTWGVVANRSYAVIDAAIGSSARITLPDQDFQLQNQPGGDPSNALYPLLVWNGVLSAQRNVIIIPDTQQRLYIMSNRTTGGFPLGFQQGGGTQFVLQNGYDAQIYADGAGTVAAAVANPQFGNVLVTGTLQVSGALAMQGWLGLGGPATVSDPLTITSMGVGGQLRLAQSGYGVIFRNDGNNFYLLVTASNNPYGVWSDPPYPMTVSLATRTVGIGGWGPDPGYALNVPTVHTSQITVDAVVNAGSINVLNLAAGSRAQFNAAEAYAIGLAPPGVSPTYIGTNASSQFQVSNAGGIALMGIDQGGNVTVANNLTVNGLIQTGASGIRFADGTVMTTAATGGGGGSLFAGDITVNGMIRGPSAAGGSPILFCYPWTAGQPSLPVNSMAISHNETGNWLTVWVRKSDGSYWINNIALMAY